MNKVKRQAYAEMLDAAVERHRAGSLDCAELLYQAILDEYPNHAEGLHGMGVLMRQTGRLPQAERCIRQSLAMAPMRAQAHHDLGLVLVDRGCAQEALSRFEQALKIDPHHLEARTRREELLQVTSRSD